MPIVSVRYRRGRRLQEIAERLSEELPGIVAAALTLHENIDGQVTPRDVFVSCVEGSRADVHARSLQIFIWAHDFPERKANLEDRKDLILHGINTIIDGYGRDISGSVCIMLQPMAFGTF